MNQKKSSMMARIALLIVAIAWGSSLVVVKSSTDSVSPNFLLALRFSIGLSCVRIDFS